MFNDGVSVDITPPYLSPQVLQLSVYHTVFSNFQNETNSEEYFRYICRKLNNLYNQIKRLKECIHVTKENEQLLQWVHEKFVQTKYDVSHVCLKISSELKYTFHHILTSVHDNEENVDNDCVPDVSNFEMEITIPEFILVNIEDISFEDLPYIRKRIEEIVLYRLITEYCIEHLTKNCDIVRTIIQSMAEFNEDDTEDLFLSDIEYTKGYYSYSNSDANSESDSDSENVNMMLLCHQDQDQDHQNQNQNQDQNNHNNNNNVIMDEDEFGEVHTCFERIRLH